MELSSPALPEIRQAEAPLARTCTSNSEELTLGSRAPHGVLMQARHCTLMVYLTTLPEEACGETFFPAADAGADDEVLVALDKLYRSGRYIVQVRRATLVHLCTEPLPRVS